MYHRNYSRSKNNSSIDVDSFCPVGIGGTRGINTKHTKLFIGGLHPSVSSKKLHSMFKNYGVIREAVVIPDKFRVKSRCYGFVTFKDLQAVEYLFEDLPLVFNNRRLTIVLASSNARPRRANFQVKHGNSGHKHLKSERYNREISKAHNQCDLYRTANIQSIAPVKIEDFYKLVEEERLEAEEKKRNDQKNKGLIYNQKKNKCSIKQQSNHNNFNNNNKQNPYADQSYKNLSFLLQQPNQNNGKTNQNFEKNFSQIPTNENFSPVTYRSQSFLSPSSIQTNTNCYNNPTPTYNGLYNDQNSVFNYANGNISLINKNNNTNPSLIRNDSQQSNNSNNSGAQRSDCSNFSNNLLSPSLVNYFNSTFMLNNNLPKSAKLENNNSCNSNNKFDFPRQSQFSNKY